jgi:hypothetical protein
MLLLPRCLRYLLLPLLLDHPSVENGGGGGGRGQITYLEDQGTGRGRVSKHCVEPCIDGFTNTE